MGHVPGAKIFAGLLEVESKPGDEAASEHVEKRPVGILGAIEGGVDGHPGRGAVEEILDVQVKLELILAAAMERVGEVQIRIEGGGDVIVVNGHPAEGGLIVVPLAPAGTDEALVNKHRIRAPSVIHAEVELQTR